MRRGLVSVLIFAAFVAVFTLSRHHTTTPITSPTSVTTTTTSTSTSSASSSTTTTAVSTTCRGADFRGTFNQGQGAAGTIYASVTLTMTGTGPCELKGFPILTLQDAKGAVLAVQEVQIGSSTGPVQFQVARANQAPMTVALHKGSTTTFSFAYSDVSTGSAACESATTMNVQLTPANTTIPITPQYPITPCNDGTMWVSPFY